MARIMTSTNGSQRDSSGRESMEPRWPASLAVTAALLLYMTLPGTLTIGPGWVIPVLEATLLIPLTIRAPYRQREEVRLIRLASLLLIALVNLAVVASLALLVNLVLSGEAVTGRQFDLLGDPDLAHADPRVLPLVLGGGPWRARHPRSGRPVRSRLPLPAMATHELGQTEWMPGFVDYLYLSFTNATAFSPTDTMPLTVRAKLLMLIEALASITTIVMVAGRAVNILK